MELCTSGRTRRGLVLACVTAAALRTAASAAPAAAAMHGLRLLSLPIDKTRTLPLSHRAGPQAVCGDALLDAGETCDDGNLMNGDGCSSSCQIEPGFQCIDPVPPGSGNVVADGSFEAGTPNPFWTEYSLQFGTPLCDPVSCMRQGASDGVWWAWFGGIDAFEEASLEQQVTIPTTATLLSFDLLIGACDSAADFLSVQVDGVEVRHESCALTPGYITRSVPTGPFADGGAHFLRFEGETFANNGGNSNFFVDRVVLDDHTGGEPVPSRCVPQPPLCRRFDFDTESGDLGGWTRFHTSALAVDWGTTDDGFCWSGTPDHVPALNVTGGSGEAACADSDAAGPGEVDMYLCSPLLPAGVARSPELHFRYNYQVFAAPGRDDHFQVLVGTAPPGAQSIGSYATVFSTIENHGGFTALPGDEEYIPIAAQDVYACFRYVGNFDWYAQVDDVELRASACDAADSDGDGVADTQDNCVDVANAGQRDTDGDGIGNDCDADFDQSCSVNFVDLGLMKAAFFQPGTTNTDMNGDGQTNFIDLGLLKLGFFRPPGPSGIPNLCSAP
jgi:cysteine-rich repeat protein